MSQPNPNLIQQMNDQHRTAIETQNLQNRTAGVHPIHEVRVDEFIVCPQNSANGIQKTGNS